MLHAVYLRDRVQRMDAVQPVVLIPIAAPTSSYILEHQVLLAQMKYSHTHDMHTDCLHHPIT